MNAVGRAALEGLREKLEAQPAAFVGELEARVRQLLANMVDGRVLPKPEADELRAAVVEFVRSEALPRLSARNANDPIVVLDKLGAYGWTALEGERPRLERARVFKHPPPPAASWPVLQELKSASDEHPESLGPRRLAV